MSLPRLPPEIWSNIIVQLMRDVNVKITNDDCRDGENQRRSRFIKLAAFLDLRRVNKIFASGVLFVLSVPCIKFTSSLLCLPRTKPFHPSYKFLFSILRGSFSQKKVLSKQYHQLQETLLQAAGLDTRQPIEETCFAYYKPETCPSAFLVGDCRVHDILNTLISALGSEICSLWRDDALRYPFDSIKQDVWQVLLATYKGHTESMLSTLTEPGQLGSPDELARILEVQLLIAARSNNATVARTLLDIMAGQVNRVSGLSRSAVLLCFREAVRLKHVEVFEALVACCEHITSRPWCSLPSYAQIFEASGSTLKPGREILMDVYLRHTSYWRGASSMVELLAWIGENRDVVAMDTVISVLRRKERKHRLLFRQPFAMLEQALSKQVEIGDIGLTRAVIQNRGLLFPGVSSKSDRMIRLECLRDSLSSAFVRVSIAKVLVENSEDLVKERKGLVSILRDPAIQRQRPEAWFWLAEKLGLGEASTTPSTIGLGASLLQDAILTLDVHKVAFLFARGIRLGTEIPSANGVNDDRETMARRRKIRQILTRGHRQTSRRICDGVEML